MEDALLIEGLVWLYKGFPIVVGSEHVCWEAVCVGIIEASIEVRS